MPIGKITFWLIFLTGAFLRLPDSNSLSFISDELAALHRINSFILYDWLGDGTEGPDQQPLGVMFFLKCWTGIFGTGIYAVRFPFFVFGLGSLYLLYLVSKKWFGETTALFSMGFMAVSPPFILFSQFALSPGLGLFFVLLLLHFFNKIILSEAGESPKFKNYAWYCFSLFSCSFFFYPSFLMGWLIWLIGLFFLKQKTYKSYLLSGLAAFLFFAIHLPVSFIQWSLQDLNPAPFSLPVKLLEGLEWMLNFSDWIWIPAGCLLVFSFIMYYSEWRFSRFSFLSLFIPFVFLCILFAWSKFTLQTFPVGWELIFFPLAVVFVFSYFSPLVSRTHSVLILCFVGLGMVGNSTSKKRLPETGFAFSKELVDCKRGWTQSLNPEKVVSVVNVNHPFYWNFYAAPNSSDSTLAMTSINSGIELGELAKLLYKTEADWFFYAWSESANLPETDFMIRDFYPVVLKEFKSKNAGVILYGKGKKGNSTDPRMVFHEFFESPGPLASDPTLLVKSPVYEGTRAYFLKEKQEFGPTLIKRMGELPGGKDSLVVFASIWIYCEDSLSDAELVVSFESLKNTYTWHSRKANEMGVGPRKWKKLYCAHAFPPLPSMRDRLKVYLWNPAGKKIYLDDFRVEIRTVSED